MEVDMMPEHIKRVIAVNPLVEDIYKLSEEKDWTYTEFLEMSVSQIDAAYRHILRTVAIKKRDHEN